MIELKIQIGDITARFWIHWTIALPVAGLLIWWLA